MKPVVIVTMFECPSAVEFQTIVTGRDSTHVVKLDPNVQDRNNPSWQCSCRTFAARKACPHIEIAQKRWCGWNQATHGGEPVLGRCPRCGQRAKPVLIGREVEA